jgi:hypothetical protein
VDWRFEEDQMRVSVNGEERASVPGNYAGLRGLVGIGPYASTVTVKELVVAGPQAAREPTPPAKMVSLLEIKNPAKALRDGVLAEQGGLEARPAPVGLRLPGPKKGDHMRLVTKEAFAVPVRIHAVAMTESTNLRLYFAGSRLIFNWEVNPRELRFHWPPASGVPVPGAGGIPTRQWVDIVWDFTPYRATIAVNGKVRVLVPGSFAGLRGQVGIGPAHGSTIALRELGISGPSKEGAAE